MRRGPKGEPRRRASSLMTFGGIARSVDQATRQGVGAGFLRLSERIPLQRDWVRAVTSLATKASVVIAGSFQ